MLLSTDGSFWPKVFPIFDFSLTFEETILQILPSSSFIFFSSILILHYRQTPVRIRSSRLLWIKLGVASILVFLELAILLLRSLSTDRTNTTYPAVSIDLTAALAICAVVYVEHRHALRTSAFFSLYLVIGILIDGTQCRSYFQRGLAPSGGVAAATAVARLVLLGLEEIPKRNLLIDAEIRNVSAGEATSGLFTRSFFVFLRPMLRTGFRGVLAMRDLDSLGFEFSSIRLLSKLSNCWPTSKRSIKHSLFFACCRAWKGAIFVILIPRLCVTGLKFSQPFVMRSIISSVNNPSSTDDKKGGLMGATLLTFGGAAVFRAASTHMKNRLVTRIRGGLLSQLFDKSYRLKVSEAKKQAAITLMSADFDGIATGLPQCIEIPFYILESGLGMYFLAHFVKQSCLVIFIPLMVSNIAGIFFGKYLTPAVRYWNEHIETRVAKTSRALSQLPAIKRLGLGPKIAEFIQHLRVVETRASKKYRRIQAFSLGAASIVDMMTPVIVIAAGLFSLAFGDKISAEAIYPTLGLVALVQNPLAELLKSYPSAMSMLGCFERIREFLCQDENSDPRALVPFIGPEGSRQQSSLSGTASTSEKEANQDSGCFVVFSDATIGPRGEKKPLLKHVSFSIHYGSVMAMFGPTCSGKTTLLQSILGEADILDGFLYIDESSLSIAFCGQVIWLPNVTIRECIVGACEYDPVWFRTVIIYCKLVQDLEQLQNGENYVIGSEGIALSGGQRQRIAIARAVYARTKAIIFDDIFSALDKPTAIDILVGLCGKGGLLRQSSCTVLVSSYMPECLEVADRLILLDGNGNVSCEPCQANNRLRSQVAGLLGHVDHTTVVSAQAASQQAAHPVTPVARSTAADQSENQSRRKGDAKLYLLWIDSIGRMSMLLWLLLVAFMATAESTPPIYVRIWIDVAPASRLYVLGYALISLSSGLLAALCLYLMFIILSPRASNGLHGKLTTTVTQSTLGFLSTTDTGSVLNRYTQDMELLAKRVPTGVYCFLYCGFTTMIQIGIILSGATYMTSILPFIFISLFFIQRYYLRTSRQLRLLDIEAQAPLVTELREIATGLVYIRGFGCQEHSFSRGLRLLDESQKPFYFLLCSQTLLVLVLDLLAAIVAVILAALTLYAKGASSPNATGVAFLSLITLGTSFERLVTDWTSMETSVGSLSRLRQFLRCTPTEAKKRTVDLPENWPSQGEVRLSNVFARYRVDDQDRQAPILRNLSLTIQPGKKIGVMGRSGCGKSSLLATLLGFLEYQGSVMIDGVDIATTDPDQLRSRIVTISQELVELDGTIRDNLLPYEKSWDKTEKVELDEKEKEELERKELIMRETLVRLRIWDQLESKGGLDAILDRVGFSHGETQLLCIARAVVRRRLSGSRLVLVDEATASVDRWRDQIVREMMKEYFKGCTIIVVAHRTETIADSNTTIHMAGGQIENVESHW